MTENHLLIYLLIRKIIFKIKAMKKQRFKFLLTAFILIYLSFSFYHLQLNMFVWPIEARGFFIGCFFFTLFIMVLGEIE